MSARVSIIAALCVIGALASPGRAIPQAVQIAVERFGLYVVTDDLERAGAFYQRVFGTPKVRVPGMIGFDVGGGLYAVVDRKKFAATAVRGDTIRGYMRVADIQATYRLLAAGVPANLEGQVVTEGSFSFFRLRDPDGNLIEFYAVKSS